MNKPTGKLKAIVVGFFILIGCSPPRSEPITLIWDGEKPIGISILKQPGGNSPAAGSMEVQLVKTGERGAVLGEFTDEGSRVVFKPLVPLTRGLAYQVFYKHELIGSVAVPQIDRRPPELLAIYPTQDTVPENLLKIYLHFSSPMVEGGSLRHIMLIRDSRDTMKGTFLDLAPELWNSDGTVLTLWLDPGRIKRDLIPNKALGAPLESFGNYSLRVSDKWKSKDGIAMGSAYVKDFTTAPRDEKMPAPDLWQLTIPGSGSSDPLHADVLETLDYSLLNDAITIVDSNRIPVKGTLRVGAEERSISFFPAAAWKAGAYIIQVEGRLEDLAGNNLNRPFDRDLAAEKETKEREVFERKFVVR